MAQKKKGKKETKKKEKAPANNEASLFVDALKAVTASLEDVKKSNEKIDTRFEQFEQRMTKIDTELMAMKTGQDDRFKLDVTEEDIEKAKEGREEINPKVVKIVDEMLGEDFMIEMEPRTEGPGFTFTLIVPVRLSLLKKETKPVKKVDGSYELDKNENPILEEYFPEDRRSKALSTMDSFDVVKKHCEMIRAHIVATYQKANIPLPEFKIRQTL